MFRNESPEIGPLAKKGNSQPEVLHHTQLLAELLRTGKLPKQVGEEEITFHDPCYLSRYNRETEAPRTALELGAGKTIKDMERHGSNSMCCGAGGVHYFFDL